MEFMNGLTDDQFALICCVAAMAVCGTLMSLSYYVGQFVNHFRSRPQPVRQYSSSANVHATSQGGNSYSSDRAA